jgi:hypothetical protein
VFRRLVREARRAGALRGSLTLRVGHPDDYPSARSYAYCESSPLRISVAPRLEAAPIDRIEGVLRHELGHAILFAAGYIDAPAHTERRADTVARTVFGRTIRYDADDVQSTRYGKSPRPSHLPR